ncbi:MAG TPA: hypothetical protein VJN70_14130 [Gemmatimonadaceae bacterium]|nr:hypothetical protein [Gemmatimonadaceae bacterium]
MDRLAILTALTLLVAACRPGSSEQTYADRVAEDVPKIEKAVGVRFKHAPKLEVRSHDQVRAFVTAQLTDSAAQRDLAGKEAAYKAFGLIPDTMNVRKLFTDLLTEQIIGYYDPKTKVLYVVKGAPDDVASITIMHELVHALQDQYINLDSLLNAKGDDDQQAAAQAVIEGEATFEQISSMLGGSANVAARLPGGWDRVRDMIRDDHSQPVFGAAPMAIQEELLFPYINGAEFVRRFKEKEPGKLPFQEMPQSTEQVMHDRSYFGTPRDNPIHITLPKVPGSIYENTLGEFDTRLFLFQHLHDQQVATRAAMGWGGDRYAVVHTSSGSGVAWVTAWDSALDAAEFVDALGQATQMRYHTKAPALSGGGVRTYTGAGRTVVVTPREINGKNVILVVDVPTGTSTQLVDLSRVTVGG